MLTNQYKIRGFHILSDAINNFTPIDGICQFEYNGYQISISTAGLSKGACQTEVSIFEGKLRDKEVWRCHTVQEAIEYINQPDTLK